jgi:hypothetical protein
MEMAFKIPSKKKVPWGKLTSFNKKYGDLELIEECHSVGRIPENSLQIKDNR